MMLIILPVRNEEHSVKHTALRLLRYLETNSIKAKIIFINDHSTDKTKENLLSLGCDKISVVDNRFDPGKGSALKTAYILASQIIKEKITHILFMDGDGQIPPDEIKTLSNVMQLFGSDVVVGNKVHPFSVTKYPLSRRIISRCYNLIVRVLFGLSLTDTQCGIKLFTKEALEKVIDRVNIKTLAFDLELIVLMKEAGLKVADCPVRIEDQTNAGSVSLKACFSVFFDTLKIWHRKVSGKYV